MFGSDVTYLQSLIFIQPIMNISTQLGGFQKPDIFYKLLNEFMYQFPLKRMADFNLCQKSYGKIEIEIEIEHVCVCVCVYIHIHTAWSYSEMSHTKKNQLNLFCVDVHPCKPDLYSFMQKQIQWRPLLLGKYT